MPDQIIDIRPRGPRHRRSIVVSVNGGIIKQFGVPRGGDEQAVILELHNRIVDKHGGALVSTSADETVLTADGVDWSKL
jgi:hypothetical protein